MHWHHASHRSPDQTVGSEYTLAVSGECRLCLMGGILKNAHASNIQQLKKNDITDMDGYQQNFWMNTSEFKHPGYDETEFNSSFFPIVISIHKEVIFKNP